MDGLKKLSKRTDLFVLALLLLFSSSVIAETSSNVYWSSEFSLPGFNGQILDNVEFNGELYVCGQFTSVNDVVSPGLVKWDGSQWVGVINQFESFFPGFPPVGSITSMTLYNGELIVAGSFNGIDGVSCGNIAAFDGFSWRAITVDEDKPFRWKINDIISFNGKLIIGGNYDYYEGPYAVEYPMLLSWDGTSWQPLDAKIDSTWNDVPNNDIIDLEVFNNELYVGGVFTSVNGDGLTKWDGTNWSNVGGGVDPGKVTSMVNHNGNLAVGGPFYTVGGIPVEHIAQWDGTNWSAYNIPELDNINSWVKALTSVNGNLYFYDNQIKEFDGDTINIIPGNAVKMMFNYNSELVASGLSPFDIENATDFLIRWDGSNWLPFDLSGGNGVENQVADMVEYNGRLIAVGNIDKAGNIPTNDIAAWNGISWESLHNSFYGYITATEVFNGKLVILANSLSYNYDYDNTGLMQWDGVNWEMCGSVPVYTSFVSDLEVYNGLLVVVGGQFEDANGNDIYGVIAVDSTNTTVTIGSGALRENYTSTNSHDAQVYNEKLYVCGNFTHMDSVYAPDIAVYDGVEWSSVPGADTMVNYVAKMTVYNNELILAGSFTNSKYLMKFDGVNWSELDGGDLNNGLVLDLQTYNGILYVTGSFQQAGSAIVNNIATWDGTTWWGLGDGANSWVYCLYRFQDDLYFGGTFTQVGGLKSDGIAMYAGSGLPTSGDCCHGMRGNIDNDSAELVDISDLVYLVDFMFANGPNLTCQEEGNVDADIEGIIDITDIVYLVDYMFTGGPDPVVCP